MDIDSTIDPLDDVEQPQCESISPNGNRCMFGARHDGGHEIQHMLGEESWGHPTRPDSYYSAL